MEKNVEGTQVHKIKYNVYIFYIFVFHSVTFYNY